MLALVFSLIGTPVLIVLGVVLAMLGVWPIITVPVFVLAFLVAIWPLVNIPRALRSKSPGTGGGASF